jgi:hypothetical protein
VRTVNDEFGDGMIDVTETARSSIASTVGTIIAKTALDTKRQFPAPPSLDTQGPPTGQGRTPRGGASDLLPAYDPLADSNPKETLDALVANLQAMPGGGGDVAAQDVSKISLGATLVVNNQVEKIESGAGLRIAAGTAVSVRLDSGASIAKLQGAGQGAAAIAAAADIQALHVSSSGIEVVKDGKPIASINELTIRGGKVNIDKLTLLGEAASAADTEQSGWVILGGLLGLARSGGVPAGFAVGAQNTVNDGRDKPVIVPGVVRGLLESKLQAAFTDLLAKQGRSLIPGVDLGVVLGVPGAPVPR